MKALVKPVVLPAARKAVTAITRSPELTPGHGGMCACELCFAKRTKRPVPEKPVSVRAAKLAKLFPVP
jgi:hypothetical protein